MVKQLGLISPVVVPLIISGLLFLGAEKQNRPRMFLATYMVMISFVFAANYFYFLHNYHIYSWLHSLHIATVLAIYPGVFLYIKLLISPVVAPLQMAVHFIPSMLVGITSGIIFFVFLSIEERFLFLAEYRFDPDFTILRLKVLFYVRLANIAVLFLQVFIYSVLVYNVLKKHRTRLSDIFSNPDRFQLNWLRLFNILLALSAFVAVFLYTVNPVTLFNDDRFLAYPLLLIAFILWFLGIMGNNQKPLSVVEPLEVTTNLSFDAIPSRPTLKEELLTWFENEKPYLDPELKIWDICAALNTNRTYISKVINTELNCNFASFVNKYRIIEAKSMLNSSPDKSLSDIAAGVGFGSQASFVRAFKEQTGISVAQFRKGLVYK